ncbi:MAG: DUF1524 domain-containing protein [Gemmatimonadota bacterium]|nr:DUF1524 domain-containing protein [Gemmatimonadota bacterium]
MIPERLEVVLPDSLQLVIVDDDIHPVLGIRIERETTRRDYDRDDYDYPASIEQRIIDNQGGHFSPYSLRCFDDLTETDIEHIVAAAEAHESGMWQATDADRRTFARDLDNLTTAAPALNRHQKSDKDPAEWMPENNRCWYVGVYVEVKKKYGLSMDQAEADSVLAVWESCNSFDLVKPRCE